MTLRERVEQARKSITCGCGYELRLGESMSWHLQNCPRMRGEPAPYARGIRDLTGAEDLADVGRRIDFDSIVLASRLRIEARIDRDNAPRKRRRPI